MFKNPSTDSSLGFPSSPYFCCRRPFLDSFWLRLRSLWPVLGEFAGPWWLMRAYLVMPHPCTYPIKRKCIRLYVLVWLTWKWSDFFWAGSCCKLRSSTFTWLQIWFRRRVYSGFACTSFEFSKMSTRKSIFLLNIFIAFSVEIKFVLTLDTLAVGSIAFATLSTAIRSSSLWASWKSSCSNLLANWFVSYRYIGIFFLSLAYWDAGFIIK